MSSLLLIIYLGVIFLTSLIGVIKFRYLTTPIKLVIIFLFITFISESTATFFSFIRKNNSSVYHFYVIISFAFYSLIYFSLLKTIKLRFSFLLMPLAFFLFCFLNSFFFQKLNNFPSINITISNVALVAFSLIYFKYSIDKNPFDSLRKNSFFWFNTSNLIYFTIQIFIWGIMNYLIKNGIDVDPLVSFALIISILYYFAIGKVILMDKK